MKNYVIINGVNSLTITGLAISKLPSISKPPLRVMTEEINGRDGDLMTELGYGAYDKELVIGLYGNYDINEVIGFFNQEGTIVFSNEDDKYYNFKIINQIDYEALIKFRTATISLHCQPFKYPLTETPEEITTEYVEEEGETLTLNDTKIAPLSIDLKGNTSQTGTPTPSSPINVNVVSGDNEVVVCGENIYNKATSINNKTFTTNTGVLTDNSNYITSDFIKVSPNTTYYVYGLPVVGGYDNNKNWVALIRNADTNGTFTTPNNCYYVRIRNYSFLSTEEQNARSEVTYLTLGNQPITYVPYQGVQNYPLYLGVENLITYSLRNGNALYFNGSTQNVYPFKAGTYTLSYEDTNSCFLYYKTANVSSTRLGSNKVTTFTINEDFNIWLYRNGMVDNEVSEIQLTKGSTPQHISDTPIELNKIGTYQDYIFKNGSKWYLHKEIGKVVLNGSETWTITNSGTANWYYNNNPNAPTVKDQLHQLSSHYPNVGVYNGNTSQGFMLDTSGKSLRIRYGTEDTVANYKTWLSNHNVSIYYILSTPTETEITDTALITQLEALKGAMSYEGQTNISQVNNDKPFILKVKGAKEGSGEGIINNIGNIYAKPIIELEGTGTIGIYKNGTQYFEVDMSSDNEITIDTENMEAYHNGVLKNRKVIGDYNKFTIDEGNNNIEITGELTKATISNYTRWL